MLDKTYDPKEIEARLYPEWEQSGAFRAHPESTKPPYCIVIPPPNVTGTLHMGHAFQDTIMDALIGGPASRSGPGREASLDPWRR